MHIVLVVLVELWYCVITITVHHDTLVKSEILNFV